MKKLNIILAIVGFVIALIMVMPTAVVADSENTWGLMESGVHSALLGVWGASGTDIFAVGRQGVILHYDGSSWTEMESDVSRDLLSVWGSSDNDVFAGGYSGIILHYDGNSWTEMECDVSDDFHSIWGSSGNDVFAVGSYGAIVHYDGSSWSTMKSPSGGHPVYAIWGSAFDDVFIASKNGDFYHYNGSSWSEMFSCSHPIWKMWGSASDDVFAVGRVDQIYHYDGNSWGQMVSAASGKIGNGCIGGRSSDDVYIGGETGDIYKYNGNSWTEMNSSSSQRIYGLWFDSGSDGFAVSQKGVILHYPAGSFEVTGNWEVTSIDGSGTYSNFGTKIESGQVTVGVSVTGDIAGEFDFVCKFYPGEGENGKWFGTSASISGTVTVDGIEHPGTLWLKGYFDTFNLTGGFPPTGWAATLTCPQGETHGWTTDGSEMAADFGWTGSCSGAVTWSGGMTGSWWTSSGNGLGTWDGVSNMCLTGKTEYQGSGTGQVSLPMSPEEVSLNYEITEDGDFILARYDSNPGSMPGTRHLLSRFVQVDSSVVSPETDWESVGLQIEYTDAEVTASILNEDTLALHWWNSGSDQWEQVMDSWSNPEENYVTGSLTHFSVYSIQGDPLVIYSCDDMGIPKNEFDTDESVYVTGKGLDPDTDYRLWLQPPGIDEHNELIGDDDFSETQELITTDSIGNFEPVEIWDIFDGLDWGQSEFSIVADNLASGTEGYYSEADDELDSVGVNGLVVYVDIVASGSNNGTSWDDAYENLQEALWNIPGTPCQVWVASGTYTPVLPGSPGARTDSFQMQNDVTIYGGFFSGTGDLNERDWEENVTVLSGDIGISGYKPDNCYHVFYHPSAIGLDSNAILDGFAITSGCADGMGHANDGGGMFNENASPTVRNCIFSNNTADMYGGAIANQEYSTPEISSCALFNNSGYNGGGIGNTDYSSPVIVNSIFESNTADGFGGGLFNYTAATEGPEIVNCCFFNNSASSNGGGISNSSSIPVVTNCILWEDTPEEVFNSSSSPIVTYCNVQGGYGIPADNNISGTPMWVNPGSGDFHLSPNSPCINSGSDAAAAGINVDFEGDPRMVGTVDMGVDEAAVIVGVMVNLQGNNRPPEGWEVPINVGFYPIGKPNSWLLNPASSTFYFSGITVVTGTAGGTRAYFQCPSPVAPGIYDITADIDTTLMNVKRSVGIW